MTIAERVRLAGEGRNPNMIARLKSGWVVACDVQPLDGYCLLLADPVVKDLNSLDEGARAQYCLDMIRVGDAIMKCTDAYRINYETWGNLDPSLHTHIVPRYRSEIEEKRVSPACKAYDFSAARNFDLVKDFKFVKLMRAELAPFFG